MVITWTDRYGEVIGTLAALSATYTASTDGTDELTILTTDEIQKGHRVIWQDADDNSNRVHEMIVSSLRTVHDKRGTALTEARCINSIAELYLTDIQPQSGMYVPYYSGQTDQQGNPIQIGYYLNSLMSAVTNGTRWNYHHGPLYEQGGTIAYIGMKETYDVSAREIIAAAIAGFNGAELRTYVTANRSTGEVTDRTFCIVYPLAGSQIADEDTKGRFTYGKNAAGITREIGDSECYTAVRVIGPDYVDDSGQVTGRRVVYLETQNAAQLQAWGKPMPDGTIGHSVYTVTTSEENEGALAQFAADTLEELVVPDVTYTVNIADMAGIHLRDYVDIIDSSLALRMRARVTSIQQDLLNETRGGTITVGKVMNYAAVATSYQTENVVTASRTSDTPATNRITSSGRSSDSTSARVAANTRDIERLKASGSGGGSLTWPIIADDSWWDDNDSFAFFDKGHNFGLTGKDNTVGVYAAADGLTPDPQNQQWSEGSEVWEAQSKTDARTGATGFFLHAVNIAAELFRFTSNPATSHIFAKLTNAGLKTTNGKRGIAFCYTGDSTTSGGTTTDRPMMVLEPSNASSSTPGFSLKTYSEQAASYLSSLFPVFDVWASSSSSHTRMCAPTPYSATGSSTIASRAMIDLNGDYTSLTEGNGSADISLRGQNSNGRGVASIIGDASPTKPVWRIRVNPSTSSSYAERGLQIDRTGIYAVNGSTLTPLHTF